MPVLTDDILFCIINANSNLIKSKDKNMHNHFFAFFSRMKYINRWALMRNTRDDNLSQHSHEVAAIAHALAVIGNKRLQKNYNCERAALLGLYHDMPEILTGDIPTPVKYFNKEIVAAYKAVEKAAAEKLLLTLPPDIREEYAPILTKEGNDSEIWELVHSADKLSALIKCVEERGAGNSEFKKAEQSLRGFIETRGCPEASIFVGELLKSYELTLDQLN